MKCSTANDNQDMLGQVHELFKLFNFLTDVYRFRCLGELLHWSQTLKDTHAPRSVSLSSLWSFFLLLRYKNSLTLLK